MVSSLAHFKEGSTSRAVKKGEGGENSYGKYDKIFCTA